MKAILKYKLPKDKADFERASRADDLCSFIWDFQQYLRGEWKYKETPDDIDTIYKKFNNELYEHNIDLDKLWQ